MHLLSERFYIMWDHIEVSKAKHYQNRASSQNGVGQASWIVVFSSWGSSSQHTKAANRSLGLHIVKLKWNMTPTNGYHMVEITPGAKSIWKWDKLVLFNKGFSFIWEVVGVYLKVKSEQREGREREKRRGGEERGGVCFVCQCACVSQMAQKPHFNNARKPIIYSMPA